MRPSALIEKFCADGACFVTRSSPGVAHIFSELYSVPEGIRKGYFKVKILELLLFLSAFPIQAAQPQHGYSLPQVQLAEQIGAYLLQNTERRLTVAELSRYFGASATLINSSFRGVYGMSPAAFLRAQKMHSAARLLRRTDRTVLDIAGQFGYDNGSKFAKAFRDVIGVSPNAYRSGICLLYTSPSPRGTHALTAGSIFSFWSHVPMNWSGCRGVMCCILTSDRTKRVTFHM
mgnify:CR=1 FL=1